MLNRTQFYSDSGFDAVHVSASENILWLGESKLYGDSKEGIKALVKDLNEHRTKKNIIEIVNDIYNSRIESVKNLTDERKAKYYDEAVETAFHIYRHWFQFTVPKAFRVVDSIQRLICERRNMRSGSYSFLELFLQIYQKME